MNLYKPIDHGSRSEEVGSFFEPSIEATVANIMAQIREADVKVAVRDIELHTTRVTDLKTDYIPRRRLRCKSIRPDTAE